MKKSSLLFLVLLGLHLFLLVNLQFTAWPEMFSFPYLKNNGFALYKDMVHPYTPLLTTALSGLYKVFGYKLVIMQAFSWALILLSDVFVFLTAKKLTKKNSYGLWALAFYVLVQPFLEGNMLWPDTAIVTPVLIGTYFLISKNYFWSGLFLTIAALTKQTAGLFLVVSLGYLFFKKEKTRNLATFLAGPVGLGSIFFLGLFGQHQLVDFFSWTLLFPSKYWTSFPGYVDTALSKRQFLSVTILFVPLILGYNKVKKYSLLVFFLLVSMIIVYPRFSFFHFQTGLAFSAILFGLTVDRMKAGIYLGLVFVLISLPAARLLWQRPPRFYADADFKIATEIPAGEKVYLLNLPSSYYVFSKSLPIKPWVDNFGWYYAVPGVEDGVIAAWQTSPPDYLMWKEAEAGDWWELGSYEPAKITNWIRLNYNKEKEVEKGIWLWRKN